MWKGGQGVRTTSDNLMETPTPTIVVKHTLLFGENLASERTTIYLEEITINSSH